MSAAGLSPGAGPAQTRLRLAAIPRASLGESALAATGFGAGAVLHVRATSFVDGPDPRFSGVVELPDDGPATPLPAGAIMLDTAVDTLVDRPAPGPAGVTLIAFVRRKAGMTLAAFREHSLSVHGPMDAAMPGLIRYRQAHAIGGADDGAEPAFDCVSLFDFADLDALSAAMSAPGSAESAADLDAFVDLASAVVLVTRPVPAAAGPSS